MPRLEIIYRVTPNLEAVAMEVTNRAFRILLSDAFKAGQRILTTQTSTTVTIPPHFEDNQH